jgi:hypothetical protein
MTPQNEKPTEKNTTEKNTADKDSLGFENKKSPWLVYAMLQIPIVIIMLTILYFAFRNHQANQ